MQTNKLEVGKNCITFITKVRIMPQIDVAKRLQTVLNKASQGLDRQVFIAITGEFILKGTARKLTVEGYCTAEIYDGELEVKVEGNGYVQISTCPDSQFKLYI